MSLTKRIVGVVVLVHIFALAAQGYVQYALRLLKSCLLEGRLPPANPALVRRRF